MLSPRSLLLAGFVSVFANAIVKPLLQIVTEGGFPPSPIAPICVAVGLYVWSREGITNKLSTVDRAVLIGASLLCFAPFSNVAWASLSILGLWFLVRSHGRSIGLLIMTVAAARTPIAEGAMTLLAEPLLVFDGFLATQISALLGGTVTMSENLLVGPTGHAVFVMSGCASFSNVSNALLVWFTIAMVQGHVAKRPILIVALLLSTAIVAINAMRLGAMTLSSEVFTIVHDGFGATAAQLAMIFAILVAIGLTGHLQGRAHHAV